MNLSYGPGRDTGSDETGAENGVLWRRVERIMGSFPGTY